MKWPGRADNVSRDSASVRLSMVQEQIRARGIKDERVLSAMETVPRHRFVASRYQKMAYEDFALPIAEGQTISQPYIVAVMTEALYPQPGQRVLEIGTGSGYQTAVLAEMGMKVYTVEFVADLSNSARELLEELDYAGIHFRVGDGHCGWPGEAPFDGIIVTAAPVVFPEILARQLKSGGRLVIPIGEYSQELKIYTREGNGTLSCEDLFPVRFVPMVKQEE